MAFALFASEKKYNDFQLRIFQEKGVDDAQVAIIFAQFQLINIQFFNLQKALFSLYYYDTI